MDISKFKKQLDYMLVEYEHGWKLKAVKPEIEKIKREVQTLSTPTILQILSWAVSCMEEDEIYLEAGTGQGGTLIGALMNNPEAGAITIDDWGVNYDFNFPGGKILPTEEVKRNLKKMGIDNGVWIVSDKVEKLLDSDVFPKIQDMKVGVYFYDACHARTATFEGMEGAMPYLADPALIIIDDSSNPNVRMAIESFVDIYGAEILYDFPVEKVADPIWWYGLTVLEVKQNE